jgi:phosphate transport system permease protein
MDKRKIEENFFKTIMIASSLIILFTLIFILVSIIIRGLPAMNLEMITRTPEGGYYLGKEGGVLNAIAGSLYLGIGSTFLAIIVSLPVVLYFNVYAKKRSKLVSAVRFSLDILWGVPSIVYGAFGFIIMLFFGLKTSLLGGIVTVALMIIPIMTRAMDEVIRMIPSELLEASYALGATRFETAFKVVTRQALPGILTALLIAFGRGIGDAASVLFTTGFSDNIPHSLLQPAATLPLAIFFQLGTPYPEVQQRAYASAFILICIILVVSFVSRILTKKLSKYVVK